VVCRAVGLGAFAFMKDVWGPVLVPASVAGAAALVLRRFIPGSDLGSVALVGGSITCIYAALALHGLWARRDPVLPARLLRLGRRS
jgi:hypothetical protein